MGHVMLDYRQVFRRHAKTIVRHAGDGSALRLPTYVRTTSQSPKLYTGMHVTCIGAELFDKPPHKFPQGHALAVPIQREPLQRGELAETLGQGRELVPIEPELLQCGELPETLGQGRKLVLIEPKPLQCGELAETLG